MGNNVTVTLTSVDKSSSVVKKVTTTYDDLNDQIERFIKNDRAKIVADNARKAFEGMTEAQKDAFLAARALDRQQGNTGLSLKSLKSSWTELSSALGIAKMAYQAVAAVASELVGEYQAQAAAVRDLALATGTGYEETSRLIQVFDDAGIDTEKLKTAMIAMNKAGLTPSIESIAEMSDEYNAIQDPLKKVEYLTDRLGSRGVEVGKAFDMTGDQIREAGKAVSDSLIFDEKKIAASEELRVAQDNLNDSFTGLKNEALTPMIPVLSDAINYLTAYIDAQKDAKNILDMYANSFKFWTGQIDDNTGAVEENSGVLGDFVEAVVDASKATSDADTTLGDAETANDQYRIAIGKVIQAQRDQATAAKDAKKANEDLFNSLDTGLTSSIDKLQEKLDFLKAGGKELVDQYNDVYAALVQDPGDPAALAQLDTLDAKAQAVDVAIGKIDGSTAAQNIADTLGVSLDEANVILSDLLARIGAGGKFNVDVIYHDPGWGGGGGGEMNAPPGGNTTPIMNAYGGPVGRGDHIYNENPATSPELPVLNNDGSGYILTKQDAQRAVAGAASGGGGSFVFGPGSVVINVSAGNADEIAKKILPSLQKLVERNRNAGTGR